MFNNNRPIRMRCDRRGITRIDVATIIVTIGVLLALLLPLLQYTRENERRSVCESRMERAAEAVREFENLHARFPGYRNPPDSGEESGKLESWPESVWPYLDVEDESQAGSRDRLAESDQSDRGNSGPTARHFAQLICPSDESCDLEQRPARISFVVNSGMPDAESAEVPPDWAANGVFLDVADKHAGEERVSLDYIQEHDGASQTLLLSENVDAGRWTDIDEPRVGFVWVDQLRDGKPDPRTVWRINQAIGKGNGRMSSARPSSWHAGGVNVAFCDGRTDFLSENVDYLVLTQLMTPYGKNARIPGTETLVAAPYRESAESTTNEPDALASVPRGVAD